MNLIFLLSLGPGGIYFAYSLFCLASNYFVAKQIGVPTVILPISPENPVWLLLGNRIVSMVKRMVGESHFTRFSVRGWVYYDKYRAALELGDHFAVVTPARIWFFVCNAQTLEEVIRRRHDFPRPVELLGMLDLFGPNVSTVEGAEWQRQRRITSVPFNDQNSALVWSESVAQAREVLEYWVSQDAPIFDTARHIRTLSLHVLSNAGFGKSYSFQKASELPKPGRRFNYRDALAHVLDHIMLLLIFGPDLLGSRFLPRSVRSIGQAATDFKAYMGDMYADEKQSMKSDIQGPTNILSSLIRATEVVNGEASEMATKGLTSAAATMRGLSESEVYGNTFVYNFAGHDTTAITLSWTIYLLAAHPHVQDWIGEEIRESTADLDPSTIEFKDLFPKLNRCLAVMLEVLRLYNPLPGIIKSTGKHAQNLYIADKAVAIPPNTRVILHTDAIHTLPTYWGKDSLEWRPQRWIVRHSELKTGTRAERLVTPAHGTYVPWSGGPRVCPGKKFSQVEFVAILCQFFRDYRVEPVRHKLESAHEARVRTLAAVKDSSMILLLQMSKPESVGLRWVKKG